MTDTIKGLAAPLTDVYCARVEGTILGIPCTKNLVKLLYWVSVIFGTFVFINGLASTGIEYGALVTKTEIQDMPVEVNFPVIWACVRDQIAEKGKTFAHGNADSDGNKGYATIDGYANGKMPATPVKSDVKFYDKLDETVPAEARVKSVIDHALVSLGAGNAGSDYQQKRCFTTNYDQKFKPRYDSSMKLSMSLKTGDPILDEKMYGILGFFEDGVKDAQGLSFTYVGFQNALHTIGIGIDEEVDAKGGSFLPATEGTTKQVYSINTAVTPSVYSSNGGGQGALQVSTTNTATLETTFVFYMNTFIRRQTLIRNKSFYEIMLELGASFAAAMLFISWGFKEESYTTSLGIQSKVKIFRFQDSASVLKQLKEQAKEQAIGAARDAVQADELEAQLQSEIDQRIESAEK